jgi:Na+/melibiose symporter-like transporter
MGLGRLLAINSMWLGQGAHWPPITFILVPATAALIAGGSADLLIGNVSAAGNIFALIAPILAGWLSDRTSTRWGRRRPWILAGTAVNLIGLGLLAVTSAPLGFAFAYMLVQLTFNLAGGAYAAVIPDVVPAPDRGRASGLLGMMNAIGAVIGLAAVTGAAALYGHSRTAIVLGYAAIVVILLVSTAITLVAVHEPVPAHSHPSMPRNRRVTAFAAATTIAVAAWISFLLTPMGGLTVAIAVVGFASAVIAVVLGLREPAITGFFLAFRNRDFFWTFATRALVMMGIATINPWLGLYFRDVLGRDDWSTLAGLWGLTLLGGAIVPGVVGGHLSDRIGRRKPFVYASGIVMALVASVLLFGLVRDLVLVFVLGLVFGIGYGLYVAVDWALACDVLPDREKSSGRDMGLWHIAFTLPPALAPALFGPVLHAFNASGQVILGLATGSFLGFRLVFAGAVVWFVLGTIFVSRIRGVR